MRITDALLGEHAIFYLFMQEIERALPTLDSLAALHNRTAPLAFSLEAHAAWAVRRGPDGAGAEL